MGGLYYEARSHLSWYGRDYLCKTSAELLAGSAGSAPLCSALAGRRIKPGAKLDPGPPLWRACPQAGITGCSIDRVCVCVCVRGAQWLIGAQMAEIRAGAAAAAEQFQSDLRGKESSGLSGRWISVCSALISCFKCTGGEKCMWRLPAMPNLWLCHWRFSCCLLDAAAYKSICLKAYNSVESLWVSVVLGQTHWHHCTCSWWTVGPVY